MRAFYSISAITLWWSASNCATHPSSWERESKDRRYSKGWFKGQIYPTVLELKLWIFEAQSRKREGRNAEWWIILRWSLWSPNLSECVGLRKGSYRSSQGVVVVLQSWNYFKDTLQGKKGRPNYFELVGGPNFSFSGWTTVVERGW